MDTSKIELHCPIAIKWSIPENLLQTSKDVKNKRFDSETFNASNISGVQYFISFFPNIERTKADLNEAWIYLHLKFPKESIIRTKFNISVESANYSLRLNQIFKQSGYGNGIRCCRTEELFDPEKGFIVDGKMTIKMDGIIFIEKDKICKEWKCENYSNSLCLALWEQQEMKDFTIVVADQEFTAHKCVLAHRSPVFARMFESGMKEAQENRVNIKDFSFEVVEAAIKLCYHHSLFNESSTLETKMFLLQIFNKYEMQELKDDLENYLITEINESTVCHLSNCSLLSNATKLKIKCSEFLQDCFKTKPIADFDVLDKDFALDLFKNSFYHLSK